MRLGRCAWDDKCSTPQQRARGVFSLTTHGNRKEIRNEDKREERFQELRVEGNGEEHIRKEGTREEERGKEVGRGQEERAAFGEACDQIAAHQDGGESPAHHRRGHKEDAGQEEREERRGR